MRKLIPFAWSLLLAGCMVGPDYMRPKTEAPAAYSYEEKDALDTANTLWWKQFQDPVLDELIIEALRHNKNIQIAAANVEQAAALLTQSKASLPPQIGYGASAKHHQVSETNLPPIIRQNYENPQASYEAILASVTWELDLWGRIRRLSEAARAQALASVEARRGVVLSLVGAVATDYLQLLGLDQQLAIAKRTLDVYGEKVKLFELQFQYGEVSEMTVQQARTQYESAAAAIPQIEMQIVKLENVLSVLLGRNPGPIARGKSLEQLAVPGVPAGLPSELLLNRPDILQTEQQLVAANAQIGAAKALYFPTISLTDAIGFASPALSDLFKEPSGEWAYAGSITGPIFTGGYIRGKVKESEAMREAALINYEWTIQSAFADVENALIARRKLIEQTEAQGRLVKASSDYLRLAQMQYDGGYAPYSTVLQAEEKLFPAELSHAAMSASLLISLVDIYKAVGGGWVAQAEGMTVPEGLSAEP